MGEKSCRSWRPAYGVCADGFIQKPYCSGNYGCPHCGRGDDKYLPACITENLPDHHANDDGTPLFYRGKSA
jgi:hypothetical protein